LHILAAITTGALLVWFARSGLFVYFTGDDTMNLYLAWRKPYSQILLQNIFYFTHGYRPMGALVYRLLFDIAGDQRIPIPDNMLHSDNRHLYLL